MTAQTLGDFVARYFPDADPIAIDEGLAVACPVCQKDHALWVRVFPGTPGASLFCPCGEATTETVAEKLGVPEGTLYAHLCAVTGPPAPTEDDGKRGHGANEVVEWILTNYRVGRSTDGLLFAVSLLPGAPRVAKEVKSIRSDVLKSYREAQKAEKGKGIVLGREVLSNALDTVSAYAETEDPVPVAIRAAQVGDDRVVLDLGDAHGHVIEVTASGWTVAKADKDTPLFRRSEATQPLPVPEKGGDLDVLRDLLGLKADDRRWMQARGWLVGSLFSDIPRPILWATGPQGSGKSTRTRMILSLVEPVAALGKEPGRNERDDSTAARGRFLVSFDNITTISQNTSDWVCRLVTGVTDDRRQLYSDDGLRPVTYKRSGVSTSITLPPGLKSDALERITLVDFDRVPDVERRAESGLWTAYEAAKPALLGALLDDVVLVLTHLRDVAGEQRSWPRMADYAQVLTALDRGLGLGDDEGHRAAYVGAVDEALAESALDDPFAAAVLAVVAAKRGHMRTTAEALVKPLMDAVTGDDRDLPKWWPKSARGVSTYLARSSEALRHAGVTVEKGKSNGARWVELTGAPAPASPREEQQPFALPF